MKLDRATLRLSLAKTPGIYRVKCVASGKSYIGGTQSLLDRAISHECGLRIHKNEPPLLQAEYDLHGADAFVFEVAEEVSPEDIGTIARRELFWIVEERPALNKMMGTAGHHREGLGMTATMSIPMDKEDKAALRRLAGENGISVSALARRLIREGLDRDEAALGISTTT